MFGNIIIQFFTYCTKKLLKRSAIVFWSSNLLLSIKLLKAAEDFTFAVGNSDRIISHADLGLSFLVSNNVAKCCFFASAIDLVNLFENLRLGSFFVFITLQKMRTKHQLSLAD